MGFIDNVRCISGNASGNVARRSKRETEVGLVRRRKHRTRLQIVSGHDSLADKRLIIVNIQGTGKKIEYKTIPIRASSFVKRPGTSIWMQK